MGFCNPLKHISIKYGDYISNSRTYCSSNWLKKRGLAYPITLRNFTRNGKQPGLIGEIFADALSHLREQVNLTVFRRSLVRNPGYLMENG